MRRLAGWLLLVCGVLLVLWALAAIAQFVLLLTRFGIPLTWDLISDAAPLFTKVGALVLTGAGSAMVGGRLALRKRRPSSRNITSHFD